MSYPTQEQPGDGVPQNPYGAPSQPYGAVPAQPYGAVPSQPYGAAPQQPYGAVPQQPYGQMPYGAPAPKRSAGKIIAIIAAIVAVVVIGSVIALVVAGGGPAKVKERLNPGCLAAEGYVQNWETKIKADQSNPAAVKADFAAAVVELKRDAAESTNAPAKAAILKLSDDIQELLDDINSGTMPPASLETTMNTDAAAVDTACGR